MPTPRPLDLKLPPLHPGQQAVVNSKARFKVVCCGRRWGKTHLGVLLCILVAAMGGRAWWIGPSYPVAGIGWRLLKSMVRVIPGIEVRESERMILFPGGGVVQVKSADRPDSLRGESLDFVVFDEVADIKEEAWAEGIRPALSSGHDYFNGGKIGGSVLFIGTPRGQGNWFFDLFLKASDRDNNPDWQAWQQPTLMNTMIPELDKEVEAARLDMHPIIFNQEFNAEFVVAGGTIFQDNWQKWYQLVGDQHSFMSDSTLVLVDNNDGEMHIYETVSLASCQRFGIVDLALTTKQSADYTVVTAWAMTPQRRLCLLDYWRDRVEAPDIIPQIKKMRSKWRLAWTGIEKVAFQASIIQQARRQGEPCRELKPDKDKTARAYTAAAHMEGGRIWWRRTIHGMHEFASEVINFPLSAHDDCTDTVSYAASCLDKIHTGPQLVSW